MDTLHRQVVELARGAGSITLILNEGGVKARKLPSNGIRGSTISGNCATILPSPYRTFSTSRKESSTMNTLVDDYKRMRQREFDSVSFTEFRDLFASESPASAQDGED